MPQRVVGHGPRSGPEPVARRHEESLDHLGAPGTRPAMGHMASSGNRMAVARDAASALESTPTRIPLAHREARFALGHAPVKRTHGTHRSETTDPPSAREQCPSAIPDPPPGQTEPVARYAWTCLACQAPPTPVHGASIPCPQRSTNHEALRGTGSHAGVPGAGSSRTMPRCARLNSYADSSVRSMRSLASFRSTANRTPCSYQRPLRSRAIERPWRMRTAGSSHS